MRIDLVKALVRKMMITLDSLSEVIINYGGFRFVVVTVLFLPIIIATCVGGHQFPAGRGKTTLFRRSLEFIVFLVQDSGTQATATLQPAQITNIWELFISQSCALITMAKSHAPQYPRCD